VVRADQVGSTTLLRILNTIPNANICGENFGAINSLLEFYRRIKDSTHQRIPGGLYPIPFQTFVDQHIKPAWYNSYNFTNIVEHIKQCITDMFKNHESTTIWGFKEIRYWGDELTYMKDFKELFPQTKIILQIREADINHTFRQFFWGKYAMDLLLDV